MRILMQLLVAVVSSSFAAPAQVPKAAPALVFDVASVKQDKAEGPQHSNVPLDTGNVYRAIDPSDSRTVAGGYFVATNQPLWQYIVFAYRLSGTQELALRFSYFDGLRSKVPAWVTGGFDVSADRFTIEARAPDGSTIDGMRLMMQALLADRFQLVVHPETRDAPALGLVLVHGGATGPSLRPHAATDTCSGSGAQVGQTSSPNSRSALGELPPVCGVIAHLPSATNPQSSFGGRGVPLSLLATSLPTMTGMATVPRPVIDQTGLAGLWDFALHWSFASDPETGDTAASFRGALRDQLGLELKPTHAPIEILVIDRVERPSAN